MDLSARVSILEKDAFKGKTVVVKVSEHLSASEMERFRYLLQGIFPEAEKVLVLEAEVDLELPAEGTICEAVPLEHFREGAKV